MPKEIILILDKESHTQRTLKNLLESEKYIVLAINSIDRALQNFSEFRVAALITEYRLDHSCTLEAVREFKRKFPESYVMMLTNDDVGENEYEEIIDAGVDDYFLKPLSAKKILLHINKGLRQRTIFLQKNRLEHELHEFGQKRDLGNSTSVDYLSGSINH